MSLFAHRAQLVYTSSSFVFAGKFELESSAVAAYSMEGKSGKAMGWVYGSVPISPLIYQRGF